MSRYPLDALWPDSQRICAGCCPNRFSSLPGNGKSDCCELLDEIYHEPIAVSKLTPP